MPRVINKPLGPMQTQALSDAWITDAVPPQYQALLNAYPNATVHPIKSGNYAQRADMFPPPPPAQNPGTGPQTPEDYQLLAQHYEAMVPQQQEDPTNFPAQQEAYAQWAALASQPAQGMDFSGAMASDIGSDFGDMGSRPAAATGHRRKKKKNKRVQREAMETLQEFAPNTVNRYR